MADLWHGYWAIQDLNLTQQSRDILIAELKTLGPESDPSPARMNHQAISIDNLIAIFEAAWDESKITIQAFKTRLAVLFDIPVETIDHSTVLVTFDTQASRVVTFSLGGIDYIRVVFFGYDGGVLPSYLQSQDEAAAYKKANPADWELDEEEGA